MTVPISHDICGSPLHPLYYPQSYEKGNKQIRVPNWKYCAKCADMVYVEITQRKLKND